MESQNHLMDAVDKRYITEETRVELNALAEVALAEVTGLMDYLQSPEALRKARMARERRARKGRRRGVQDEADSLLDPAHFHTKDPRQHEPATAANQSRRSVGNRALEPPNPER